MADQPADDAAETRWRQLLKEVRPHIAAVKATGEIHPGATQFALRVARRKKPAKKKNDGGFPIIEHSYPGSRNRVDTDIDFER